VVIAIIAILAAIIAPNAFKAIEKAKISKAAGDMKTIKAAALAYYVDTGKWPLQGVGGVVRGTGAGFLTDDDGNGVQIVGWDGPYLEKWPLNPWGDSSSAYGNQYYWDADCVSDDNGDGIIGEVQAVIFNIPRKSAQTLDERFDNGVLLGVDVGFIYQSLYVSPNPTDDPMTLSWLIYQPACSN
ncbi:MAG: type II secretion system protein GspG, partial [Candidatus Omnitrophota bacterium]